MEDSVRTQVTEFGGVGEVVGGVVFTLENLVQFPTAKSSLFMRVKWRYYMEEFI